MKSVESVSRFAIVSAVLCGAAVRELVLVDCPVVTRRIVGVNYMVSDTIIY